MGVALLPVRIATGGANAIESLIGQPSPNQSYRDLATLFRCCLIDRTETLACGFRAAAFDPFPGAKLKTGPVPAFGTVCDAVADELVAGGPGRGPVWLLWSGGIDSTVAAAALLGALDRAGADHCRKLRILFSKESAEEYPRFFHETLARRADLTLTRFEDRVSDRLKELPPRTTLVTGEHGDQLFGSDKLRPFVADGSAFEPYPDLFPFIADRTLGRLGAGGALLDWLAPQLAVCPRPLETLFDLYWWFNFSLKWQLVSLRIPVSTGRKQMAATRHATRHFFADRRFQDWAVRTDEPKHGGSWETCKLPAKRYLLDRTGDEEYFATKTKRASLRGRIAGGPRKTRTVWAQELN